MPRYSLDFAVDLEEEEEEPPHPVGFGTQWRRTWVGLDPPARVFNYQSTPGRSTYALEEDDAHYSFSNKQTQRFPPISSYIPSQTVSTNALLRYAHESSFGPDNDADDSDSDMAQLQRMLSNLSTRSPQRDRLLMSNVSSPSIPSDSQRSRDIEKKLQLYQAKMDQEHQHDLRQVQKLVLQLQKEADAILQQRQDEADREREELERQEAERQKQEAKRKQLEEAKRQKEEADKAAQEQQQQEEAAKETAAPPESRQPTPQEKQSPAKSPSSSSKSGDFVAKAKRLVTKLVAVRESIEPFDKNKAVSKRRLGMKKVVRGKINTLSENADKIRQVATEVSQAISEARQEDERLKQALAAKDPSVTPDMARGKRYLVDLVASNTIQRVQAEGFNGPRGDGFPLANMLAMVSVANEELVPILAAHIYTVCPTAIPTLPTPAPNCSEEELMSSLGMLKDKNGQYETFDRFLSRTENIVSLVSNIMSSSPTTHILMGGHKAAVEWLDRFLDLLPLTEKTTLPLLTSPVLHGFLSGAGHMLANKHTEAFTKQLDTITTKVVPLLDEGPIGKPSSIRLTKLIAGGLEAFKTTLPSRALPELYTGSQAPAHTSSTTSSAPGGSSNPFGSSGGGASGASAPTPFGNSNAAPSNPFGSSAPGSFGGSPTFGSSNPSTNPSPFGGSSGGATPFGASGGGGATNPSPFGANSNSTPFGNTAAPTNPSPFGGSNTNAFGSGGGGAAPGPSPFGAPAPSSTPFGGGGNSMASPSPFGGGAPANPSPFGATNSTPFGSSGGGAASNPSPFGAPASTPFGSSGGAMSNPAPFGAPSSAPFGSNSAPSNPSQFGAPTSGGQSTPFGSSGGGFGNSFSGGGGGGGNQGGKGKPPCKFFAQGRCKFGASCKFSHETGGGGNNGFGFRA
eukprot:Nitzschia sp. Nitz4//scaffold2_size372955//204365//207159//NITZ4_000433-RA/size372955-snap-gene-0.34-mRNA-1//1//CDS//3329546808//9353//frame0